MLRKLLVALTMAGLVAVVAPSQADAQQTGTVVFTAGAEVCHPGISGTCADGTPADFWAPVAPLSSCDGNADVLCDPPANVRFEFSTANPGLGGQTFCAGVASNGTTTGVDTGTSAGDSCTLASTGVVNPGIANVGPYCGYSSGQGLADATVDGISINGVTVRWPQSAGTLLPLIYSVGGTTAADTVGTGAVQTTGATPGTCGLDPNTGFAPTNAFAVSGYSSIAIP